MRAVAHSSLGQFAPVAPDSAFLFFFLSVAPMFGSADCELSSRCVPVDRGVRHFHFRFDRLVNAAVATKSRFPRHPF